VKLVELRGVEDGFPLYGSLVLDGGTTYSRRLLDGRGTLVPPEFLVEMGVAVGDTIRLGGQPFTIRGVVVKIGFSAAAGDSRSVRDCMWASTI
jgi:putative ABC transport system permease protein